MFLRNKIRLKVSVAIEYFHKTQNNIDTPKMVNILILNVSTLHLSHLQQNATYFKKPTIYKPDAYVFKVQYIHTLLNYPANLLDCNYSRSLVDLIYSNCKVIDLSNDWSLLLFKKAFHIRRLNQVLNHIDP